MSIYLKHLESIFWFSADCVVSSVSTGVGASEIKSEMDNLDDGEEFDHLPHNQPHYDSQKNNCQNCTFKQFLVNRLTNIFAARMRNIFDEYDCGTIGGKWKIFFCPICIVMDKFSW